METKQRHTFTEEYQAYYLSGTYRKPAGYLEKKDFLFKLFRFVEHHINHPIAKICNQLKKRSQDISQERFAPTNRLKLSLNQNLKPVPLLLTGNTHWRNPSFNKHLSYNSFITYKSVYKEFRNKNVLEYKWVISGAILSPFKFYP